MTRNGVRPRVLVIDDDPSLLRVTRLTLVSDGIDVVTAADGAAGLLALETNRIDAVVLDLHMPKMDGRAFYRECRARGYEVPVMILSAYDAEAARAELQAQAAMTKPFRIDELVDGVLELVDRRD